MATLQKIENLPALKLRKPDFETMPIYRIQLAITVGTGPDFGTDDTVYVLMNNADARFFLVRGIDNFQSGKTVVYDVLSSKVRKVKDLQFLQFGVKGNDGVGFKKVELYLNGASSPMFSKEYPGKGSAFDNDDARSPKQLTITGTEMRNSASWKNATNSNDLWLPMQRIPKEMIVSLVEAAVGNQIAQQGDYSWGNTSGINTIWGPAVEVSYKNAFTLHFDLDLQLNLTGPNPELDVDFDLEFACVAGVIQTTVKNLKTDTNLVGTAQEFIRAKLAHFALLFGTYLGGPLVGSVASGLLTNFLAFSTNYSSTNPNLSQSCRIIRVTRECDIVLF